MPNPFSIIQPFGPALVGEVITAGSQVIVTFANISTAYSHLLLIFTCAELNNSDQSVQVRVNNDPTTGNYNDVRLVQNAVSSTAGADTNGAVILQIPGLTNGPQSYAAGHIFFPNYSLTGSWRAFWSEHNKQSGTSSTAPTIVSAAAGWKNTTDAINRLDFRTTGTGFRNGDRWSLYGIV